MGLLHEAAKRPLANKLRSILEKAHIRHGVLPTYDCFEALRELQASLDAKVRQKLTEIIDEHPLITFVYDRLSDELGKIYQYQEVENKVPLASLEGFPDLLEVASRIVQELDSLPQIYTAFVPLPFLSDSPIPVPFQLSPSIELVRMSSSENAYVIPTKSESERAFVKALLGDDRESFKPWEEGKIYLRIRLSGFITERTRTSTLEQVTPIVKEFFGLGLARGLFEFEETESDWKLPRKGKDVSAAIFADTTGTSFLRLKYFQRDEAQQILKVRLAPFYLEKDDSDKESPFGGIFGVGVPKAEYRTTVALAEIAGPFHNEESGRNVRLAGQWFFESYCGSNRLLHIVQLATTLEIILGSSQPEKDLTNLLANRCAFLIGTDHANREHVKEVFAEAYDLRSKIVHQGKNLTSSEEWNARAKFEWLVRRTLTKEMRSVPKPATVETDGAT